MLALQLCECRSAGCGRQPPIDWDTVIRLGQRGGHVFTRPGLLEEALTENIWRAVHRRRGGAQAMRSAHSPYICTLAARFDADAARRAMDAIAPTPGLCS